MGVIRVDSAENYTKLISSEKISVVLFSAPWAEQCQHILDVLADLSSKSAFNELQFVDIAAEDYSEISMTHQIEAVPTIVFFRSGAALDRIDGVDVAALTAKCKEFAGVVEDEKTSIEDRLKALINRAPIMMFMKGDRNTPRCGFSKQLIAILNDTGCTYDTFDILTDETVRQELKTYSDWPTYPQVYVKGELIGGLDIIKDLLQGGELNEALGISK